MISSGITTAEGIKAADELAQKGVDVHHVHMSSLKPIDADAVVDAAKRTKCVVTVENHTVIGGLGSAVAEVLCERHPARVVRLGLQDHFGETAKLAYMMKHYGIDSAAIVKAALDNL